MYFGVIFPSAFFWKLNITFDVVLVVGHDSFVTETITPQKGNFEPEHAILGLFLVRDYSCVLAKI